MAQFIGFLQGNRGDVSRLGSKSSGMQAQAQGWRIGGRVYCSFDPKTGRDVVSVDITSGSNGAHSSIPLGAWTLDDKGDIVKAS